MAKTLRDQLHGWRKERGGREVSLYIGLGHFLGNLKPGCWFTPVSCTREGGPFVKLETAVRLFTGNDTVTYNCVSVSTGRMFYFRPDQKVRIVKGRAK